MHRRATIMNAKVTGSEYGRESTLTLTLDVHLWSSVPSVDPHRRRLWFPRRHRCSLCVLCGPPSPPRP